MQTIVELHDRDNVIITDTAHRQSVDTDICTHDYARLMYYHMRADAMTAILSAIICAVLPDIDQETARDNGLLELAEQAISNLA